MGVACDKDTRSFCDERKDRLVAHTSLGMFGYGKNVVAKRGKRLGDL